MNNDEKALSVAMQEIFQGNGSIDLSGVRFPILNSQREPIGSADLSQLSAKILSDMAKGGTACGTCMPETLLFSTSSV